MIEFLENMFVGNPSQWGGGVAHSVLILSLVVAIGVMFGKIKIAGVSFGVTWILFIGIVFGSLGLNINEHLLHFMKEFGLILFVYSVGLQVGPGFFSAFRKGGLSLNVIAMVAGFVGRYFYNVNYFKLIGVLSGSMTNPPALAYSNEQTSCDLPSVGYATVYPLTMFLRVLSAQLLIIFFV